MLRRTVALKVLRAQTLDARHLAYFEVERQLLAQMRHPAIAQVYDAGTTADYIVVEMAKHLLGERWMADYVERANNGGIERVLV